LSEGFFLNLQTEYDLMRQKRKIGATLKAIVPRVA
jgi:antitoxin HigA-1